MRRFLILFAVMVMVAGFPAVSAQEDESDSGPRTTNFGGNFFDEPVQIAGDLCFGENCTDGESNALGTARVDSDRPSILFNDSSTLAGFPTNDWEIRINDNNSGGNDYFGVVDITSGERAFSIEAGAPADGLVVAANGIGVGTAAPEAAVDVLSSDGAGQVLVRETNAAVAARQLMRLENNGGVRFQMKDTDASVAWQFQIGNNGAFGFSRQGTGGPELQVFEDGSIAIGPGAAKTLTLDATGNLEVTGTVTDGSGTTLADLTADNATLRTRVADLEARLAAMETLLEQLGTG